MLTLNKVSALTEDEARETIERILWPDGPVCAHCGATENITRLQGQAHRPGVFQCNNCHEQFTVTVGTIFEDSHLPLRKWLMAFALLCSAKKGISALQLQRELDLGSYRTAWHLAHRIRHAMSKEPLAGLLKGTVEADETYVGGKPRKPAGPSRGTGEPKRRGGGRSTRHRTPVVALVEREGGRSVAKPTIDATSGTLTPMLRAHIDQGATLMTDSWRGYIMVGREFQGGHHRVDHGAGEYARGSAHVNTAESFFALLKRGIVGSFHHVSPEHLHRYCDEFSFRWDYRAITDSERTEVAIRQTVGKRLSYRHPTVTSKIDNDGNTTN
jgi:transposase-like protein